MEHADVIAQLEQQQQQQEQQQQQAAAATVAAESDGTDDGTDGGAHGVEHPTPIDLAAFKLATTAPNTMTTFFKPKDAKSAATTAVKAMKPAVVCSGSAAVAQRGDLAAAPEGTTSSGSKGSFFGGSSASNRRVVDGKKKKQKISKPQPRASGLASFGFARAKGAAAKEVKEEAEEVVDLS